jgi:hypothetical protein
VRVAPPRPLRAPLGWDLPLRTEGRRIVDAQGGDVTPRFATGVAKMGLEYGGWTGTRHRENDPAYYAADADRMVTWGVQLVRVPTNRFRYYADAGYRGNVHALVDTLADRGILTLVELHWWGEAPYPGQLPQQRWGDRFDRTAAWRLANGSIAYLADLARSFRYQPMMVGVEINEYRPMFGEDPGYTALFRFELAQRLADAVHRVNPDLLVFAEFVADERGVYGVPGVTAVCRQAIAGRRNLVYAPHTYFTPRYGSRFVWASYVVNPVLGRQNLRSALDAFRFVADTFELPTVATEWGVEGAVGPRIARDQLDYFADRGWGAVYWSWFRQAPGEAPYGMGLLLDDWATPSAAGAVVRDALRDGGA